MIDKNDIHDFFKGIRDPLTGVDILTRGLINKILIDENAVSVQLALSDKVDSTQRVEFITVCQNKFSTIHPNHELHLHFEKTKVENNSGINPLPQVKNIIAVGSGKGGVGKSTVAVNLAISLVNQGYAVGLMDGDLYGPSIPTMLGLQGEKPKVEKLYGKPKIVPLQKFGLYLISVGFVIEAEQAVVLRGPRLGGIIKQFVQECLWPPLDYLFIDLPPGTGDIQLTLVQTLPITGALIVTTPQQVAIDDALKAMNMFLLSNVNVPILGIVENMSWFTPSDHLEERYYLFGQGGGQKLANMGNTELLIQLPLVQSAGESADKGLPVSTMPDHPLEANFSTLAKIIVERVKSRNEDKDPSKIVQVNR